MFRSVLTKFSGAEQMLTASLPEGAQQLTTPSTQYFKTQNFKLGPVPNQSEEDIGMEGYNRKQPHGI
jgi:hypothetical protein